MAGENPVEFVKGLDHPLLFLLFLLLALNGLNSVLNWGAQRLGLTGLAALFKNP